MIVGRTFLSGHYHTRATQQLNLFLDTSLAASKLSRRLFALVSFVLDDLIHAPRMPPPLEIRGQPDADHAAFHFPAAMVAADGDLHDGCNSGTSRSRCWRIWWAQSRYTCCSRPIGSAISAPSGQRSRSPGPSAPNCSSTAAAWPRVMV